MLNTLLLRIKKKQLVFGSVLALLVICGFPVPTVVNYVTTSSRLDNLADEAEGLAEYGRQLRNRERALLDEVNSLYGSFKTRFTGLNSVMNWRALVIKLAEVNDIQVRSCTFEDAVILNRSETSAAVFPDALYSVVFDINGASSLESLMMFISILEELDIGVRILEFSAVKPRDNAGAFSYYLVVKCHFLAESRERRDREPREG